MRKTATLVALAAVGMALAGCGASLPKAEAERLVLDYGQHHCKMTVLYQNPTVDMSAMFAQPKPVEIPIHWLLDKLQSSGDFSFVSSEPAGAGLIGTRYRGKDGWDYYVSQAPAQQFGVLVSKAVIGNFQGCMYRPASAKVLDVTVNKETGKQATVVVTWPTEEPTLFGKAVLSSDVAPQMDPGLIQPQPGREYEAQLEKLDEGGWRVVSLQQRGGS